MDYEYEWERVDADTYRLAVPGGWLYRYRIAGICFVPNHGPELIAHGLAELILALRAMERTP